MPECSPPPRGSALRRSWTSREFKPAAQRIGLDDLRSTISAILRWVSRLPRVPTRRSSRCGSGTRRSRSLLIDTDTSSRTWTSRSLRVSTRLPQKPPPPFRRRCTVRACSRQAGDGANRPVDLRFLWVEVNGFEPSTSAVRRQRSTGLSYTPRGASVAKGSATAGQARRRPAGGARGRRARARCPAASPRSRGRRGSSRSGTGRRRWSGAGSS